MSEESPLRVKTPICRLSFPALFKQAKPMTPDAASKYQCELIFEKGADLSKIEAAIKQASVNKWGNKIPKGIRLPIRDGEEREGEAYEGAKFMSVRSDTKPGVVMGRNREPVPEDRQDEVYAGCYVMVSMTAFAYDVSGNKGVSFGLNNVWKVRDGEPLDGRRSAESDFGDEELDEDAFGSDEDIISSML